MISTRCFTLTSLLLVTSIQSATPAPPAWWSSGTPPVIDPGSPENNKAPANIGQAKWVAKNALDALRAVNDPTADLIEADLVGANPTDPNLPAPGKIIASWGAPLDAAGQAAQHGPLLIGQLKAISAPFYHHLNNVSPGWLAGETTLNGTSNPGTHLPWTLATSDDSNKAVANIGQLKAVFSLRFEKLDVDQDGMLDAWEWLIINHSLSDSITSIYHVNPDHDYDGDGIKNRDEERFGTDGVVNDSAAGTGVIAYTYDFDTLTGASSSSGGTFSWSFDENLNPLTVSE